MKNMPTNTDLSVHIMYFNLTKIFKFLELGPEFISGPGLTLGFIGPWTYLDEKEVFSKQMTCVRILLNLKINA